MPILKVIRNEKPAVYLTRFAQDIEPPFLDIADVKEQQELILLNFTQSQGHASMYPNDIAEMIANELKSFKMNIEILQCWRIKINTIDGVKWFCNKETHESNVINSFYKARIFHGKLEAENTVRGYDIASRFPSYEIAEF